MRQIWEFPEASGTVVVGCDNSWESQNAVVAATREAARRDAKLVLLAVVEHRSLWPERLARVTRSDVEPAMEAQTAADRAMARVAATDPAVSVQVVVANELDSPELAEVARNAALLVLGPRGDAGQVAFSLGSMSAELARRFTCPMLVVHDQHQPSGSPHFRADNAVVAGVDIIGGAGAVLSVAVTEAVIRHLPLVVVHAIDNRHGVDEAMIAEGWRRCQAVLSETRIPAGVPSRLVVIEDDPARALLHRVGPGDLLIVGTHGQGRLAGLITGSVSWQVLDRMTCDVMVVQPALKISGAIPSALAAYAGRA